MASSRVYEKITDWLVPALLAGAIGVLAGIYSELQRISHSLAVAVQRVEDHDRRLQNLEQFFFRSSRP